MPSYHVEFATPSGERAEAALNASSLPQLAQRLQEQQCKLLRVRAPSPDRSVGPYWRRISEAEAATFLRQLATNLENGVSLADALSLLAREARNVTLKAVVLDIERSVRGGDSLSCALNAYPRLFSPIYVRLLEAGEVGNRLPEVLRHLAEYSERASQVSQRIRSSLVYPQVVGLFTAVLMCLTFWFVVPRFIELFKELGVKEFPLATQSLLFMSSSILPGTVIAAPFVFLIGMMLYRRSERRAAFQLAQFRMRLPLVGSLYHHVALLRLTRLLAALLGGGVPLLEALRLAGQGAESPLLQAAMWDAIPRVAAGETLATAFSHSGILPPTFCGQVAASETSGDLPGSFRRLSDWYAERTDYLAARIGALIEPLMILLLAAFAGWIAFGVFAPLVAIIQSLSGGGN